MSLSGAELARGAAITRVNEAAVDASRNPAPGAGARPPPAPRPPARPGAGGLTLPTRVPTVAAGGAPATGAAPAAARRGARRRRRRGRRRRRRAGPAHPRPHRRRRGAPAHRRGAGAAGRLRRGPRGPRVPLPARRLRPRTSCPSSLLYLIPLAGLGIAVFSLIWERLVDRRDRFAGRLWTLLLAYGGLLLTGYVLYKAATAQPGNVLLGAGAVVGLTPALWGVFLAFLFSAACLTVAWLSPAPPPPDPYWRARAPVAA